MRLISGRSWKRGERNGQQRQRQEDPERRIAEGLVQRVRSAYDQALKGLHYMANYEQIYQDLCSRYSAEEVQNFFDTIERRIRDRVALEVVSAVKPNALFVTVPSTGGEREVTLQEVEQKLRERAESSPSYTPPKGGTTGRAVLSAAANLVKEMRQGD